MKSFPLHKKKTRKAWRAVKMRMIKVLPLPCPTYLYLHKIEASTSSTHKSRRAFSLSALTISLSALVFSSGNAPTTSISWANPQVPKFLDLPNSGGVKALDLRVGDGETPIDGDLVPLLIFFLWCFLILLLFPKFCTKLGSFWVIGNKICSWEFF